MQTYSFIEKYLLKKRYIFYYDLYNKVGNNIIINNIINLSLNQDIPKDLQFSDRLISYIKKREGKESWRLFLYIEGNKVLGYSFLHVPLYTEWNDSLPTYRDEARESSTYVEASARGRGIRGYLLASQKQYCLEKNKKMWCVIESINSASIKSTKKSGVISIEKNYLIKLMGRNIFSILTKSFKLFLLLGDKRASR